MFLRQALLFVIGSSAGSIVAGGVYAFLAVIGVFPRLIGTTGTKSHIMLCETMMILGGIYGNLMDLYHIPRMFGGMFTLAFWGITCGIFVGCLVMSLAETLKALPVLGRRIHLATGLQYVIASIAAGKLVGSVIYFVYGFGGT